MPETNPEVTRIMERFKKAKSKRQKKDNMWKTLDSYNRNEVWEVEEISLRGCHDQTQILYTLFLLPKSGSCSRRPDWKTVPCFSRRNQ